MDSKIFYNIYYKYEIVVILRPVGNMIDRMGKMVNKKDNLLTIKVT